MGLLLSRQHVCVSCLTAWRRINIATAVTGVVHVCKGSAAADGNSAGIRVNGSPTSGRVAVESSPLDGAVALVPLSRFPLHIQHVSTSKALLLNFIASDFIASKT